MDRELKVIKMIRYAGWDIIRVRPRVFKAQRGAKVIDPTSMANLKKKIRKVNRIGK